VLVLPPGRAWDGAPVDTVVEGGADRGASVRNGLAAIPDQDGVVVVHQAANPLATPALIRRLLDELDAGAHAVAPGLRPADLVRRAEGDRLGPVVGRDDLVLVQTPAAFRLPVLRAAHASGAAGVEDTALVTASASRSGSSPATRATSTWRAPRISTSSRRCSRDRSASIRDRGSTGPQGRWKGARW
jgi:2-C-methyl-D-erythritol 4-phosphate cytidylyltransferase